VTGEARHVVGHDDAVPHREPLDAGADLRDLAHDLVAEDGGRRVVDEDLGDIRAAEATAAEPQQELARADLGSGPLPRRHAVASVVDGRPHAATPIRVSAHVRSAITSLRAAGSDTRWPKTRNRRASSSPKSAK